MKPIVEYLINKNTKSDKLKTLDINELWVYHQFPNLKCLENANNIKELLEEVGKSDELAGIRVPYLAELIMINALNMGGQSINPSGQGWLQEFDDPEDAEFDGKIFSDPVKLYKYCLSKKKKFAKEVKKIIDKLLEYGFDDLDIINDVEYNSGEYPGPHEYYYFLNQGEDYMDLKRKDLINDIKKEKSLYDNLMINYK